MTTFAAIMNFLCDRFFSTSTFAINDHAVLRRANQFDVLQHLFKCMAIAKYILTTYSKCASFFFLFLRLLLYNGRMGFYRILLSRFLVGSVCKSLSYCKNDFIWK